MHLLVRLGGGLLYALPVEAVREVVPYSEPRALPSDDATLVGVVAIRGSVVSVHDVAPFLGGRATEAPTLVAVLAGAEPHAIVVERVEGMRELEPPKPPRRGALVAGFVADGDEVIAVVDGKTLLRKLAPPRRRR